MENYFTTQRTDNKWNGKLYPEHNGWKNNFFCAIVIWKLHIILIALARLLFTLKHALNWTYSTYLTHSPSSHCIAIQLNVGIGYELYKSSHRPETQSNGLCASSLYKLTVTNNAQKQNKKLQAAKVKLKVQLRINNNNHKSQKKNFVSQNSFILLCKGT